MGLIGRYIAAFREEPKLRMYVLGAFVDDIGIAISAWAGRLLMVALFTDQRERAKLMVPTLLCFLLGTIFAGPLADWAARGTPAQLARWRWRIVVWGRIVETIALGMLIFGVTNKPTIHSIAPYMFVSAFMKTLMRPTRVAFHVDLLHRQEPQVDAQGVPLLDERGAPRMYKVHLLAFDSMTAALNTGSVLGGLLLGGKILAWASGRYVPLLVIDVITNSIFIAFIAFGCHPDRSRLRLSDLFRDPDPIAPISRRAFDAHRSIAREAVREIATTFREAFQFLVRKEQRSLLILMSGSLLFEWIYECYDGGMIIKQVLHGSDEQFRRIEIAWTCVTLLALALLPMFARWVFAIGKLFTVMMIVDGLVIVLVGHMTNLGPGALLAVALLLGADRTLTNTSSALVDLAQNSASSAGMRGRLASAYAFVAIIGDIGAEMLSTALSDRYGTGGMLVRIGFGQVAIILLLALLGGRAFWSYGLRSR